MEKKQAKKVSDSLVQGFYERLFENKADLEVVAIKLIRKSISFNYYWDSRVDNEKTGYYLSVASENSQHLKYADYNEEQMFDEVCESWEREVSGNDSTLHYFLREKLRELYDLRGDDSLMEEFIQMKEG